MSAVTNGDQFSPVYYAYILGFIVLAVHRIWYLTKIVRGSDNFPQSYYSGFCSISGQMIYLWFVLFTFCLLGIKSWFHSPQGFVN